MYGGKISDPFAAFSETAAADRSLHDRGANKLCSHHTRRIRGHGPGIGIGMFWSSFLNIQPAECCTYDNHTLVFAGGPRSGPDEI